ncbi:DNA repair protein RadA [Desulfosarcina sp. OttesenSCG-928-A07]|nr:DNA repair protein RadA [Desulfosarcina sp. OttesenSCG-928-G17]MDL2328614.1 DNA repair protein RadA [Desulfosarcina sp. OttesenSCG-928-A07]
MTRKSPKTLFACQSCGYESPKWMGRCTECGAWDAFTETRRQADFSKNRTLTDSRTNVPVPIDDAPLLDEVRLSTGIGEFDRVLGGGLVTGSLVLIGGDPGIGKSTLMLQVLHGIAAAGQKALYVSGEESVRQIRLRSRRLDIVSHTLLVVSEIDLDAILAMVEDQRPDVLVVDSIQTLFSPDLTSAPGSVSQVRESAMRLMLMAKRTGIPTFLVGHVTKDGAIAGPRLLEHMVDTVLYFEGDRNHIFRILRAVKNRFGSTNEIGVFEMKSAGLCQVENPSSVFLSERPAQSAGSVVTSTMEGTRPILVELQALVANSHLGTPRRTILGLDANRVALLVAVMEKQLGMQLTGHDIFMNVAGGVKVLEPAVDLAIVAAVASSFLDRPVRQDTLVMGEVGLAGEIRAVGNIENRVMEAKKMGFSCCVVPLGSMKRLNLPEGLHVEGVSAIRSAVDYLF